MPVWRPALRCVEMLGPFRDRAARRFGGHAGHTGRAAAEPGTGSAPIGTDRADLVGARLAPPRAGTAPLPPRNLRERLHLSRPRLTYHGKNATIEGDA